MAPEPHQLPCLALDAAFLKARSLASQIAFDGRRGGKGAPGTCSKNPRRSSNQPAKLTPPALSTVARRRRASAPERGHSTGHWLRRVGPAVLPRATRRRGAGRLDRHRRARSSGGSADGRGPCPRLVRLSLSVRKNVAAGRDAVKVSIGAQLGLDMHGASVYRYRATSPRGESRQTHPVPRIDPVRYDARLTGPSGPPNPR
jgi:hypothetical protein